MASEQEIIKQIENFANMLRDYSVWTIGITNDPERRRSEHDSTPGWHHWDAETEDAARRIEKYFLDKGMKGDTGGGDNPTYVYMF